MKRASRVCLRAGRGAATTVEFALVCAPLVIFLLAILSVGLQFYLQQALDYATQQAVRQVQLGHLQPGYTEADFVNKVFCPVFGQFQVCDNLSIDLQPVTEYEHLTQAGGPGAPDSGAALGVFCPGTPGQLMYAHIVYQAPSIGGALLGAARTSTIVSNAAFANENPSGVTTAQAGC